MTGKCTLICETKLTNSGGERLSISPIGQEHVIKMNYWVLMYEEKEQKSRKAQRLR